MEIFVKKCLICKNDFVCKDKYAFRIRKFCSKKCQGVSSRGISPTNKSHGMSGTKFYRIYGHIKSRCNNPNVERYPLYGGRGITYKWQFFSDFMNDMYESYLIACKELGERNVSIDRVDNNDDYYKENCRWATNKQQTRNTRRNHLLTYKGQTMCFTELAEKYNLSAKQLYKRLTTFHWSLEKSLNTPLKNTL